MGVENRLGTLPEEALVRRERQVMAKKFLGDVLLPLIVDNEELNYKRIGTLADEFKEKHRDRKGSDFDLAHVWFVARRYLARAQSAAEKGVETPELELAQRVFDIINEAEQTRVDAELTRLQK